jgi:hypothetical protein
MSTFDRARDRRHADIGRKGRAAEVVRLKVIGLRAQGKDSAQAEAEAQKAEEAFKRAKLVDILGTVREARHMAWARNPMMDIHPEAAAPPDYSVIEKDVQRMSIAPVEDVLRLHAPERIRHVW